MKLEQIWTTLANETQISMVQVKATLSLLEAGNTVPFVARYRKEQTGSLNENQIRVIAERFTYLKHLGERQHEVLRKISAQNRLTDEVQQAVLATVQLQELEDLYRPFQQKRKSRATKARERGLEGLAQYLLSLPQEDNLLTEFYRYLGQPIQAEDLQSALQGAVDILAEQIADDPQVRTWVRRYGFTKGIVEVEKKAAEPVGEQTYQMYYQYSEPVVRILPHRILAINRGEKEGFLKVKIKLEPAEIIRFIENKYIYKSSPTENWVRSAVLNAYSRLLAPAVERAVRRELTQRAESQALRVFATNLRQLLLQPPVKGKRVLGLDPAYRTGCKWAAVEDTGKLLSVGVVY
ncbi:RNA-binding transcriptional accessory protein, partial [Alicyclobacillaceae bacterium I2511]